MRRFKRAIAITLILGLSLGGLQSCAGGRAGGALMRMALGAAVSVGGYYLVQELTKD